MSEANRPSDAALDRPLRPGQAPGHPEAAGAGPPAGLRILIADDSTVTRRVMTALLTTLSPDSVLVEAASGAATGEALIRERFDLAFVDMHMPDMDGATAVAQARAERADPLVVFMGDHVDEASTARALEVNAYEFLKKPLEENDFKHLLANAARMRQPCRALVVDDSRSARQLMAKVLAGSRFATDLTLVESGEAALARLRAEPADIVFLDYAMPGLDGLETACLIQERMPEVRVVMVSASESLAVEKAALYFGAVYFLRKPFYAREVDRAMHVAFDLALSSLLMEPARAESPPEPAAA